MTCDAVMRHKRSCVSENRKCATQITSGQPHETQSPAGIESPTPNDPPTPFNTQHWKLKSEIWKLATEI
jgi:hypothetical protein